MADYTELPGEDDDSKGDVSSLRSSPTTSSPEPLSFFSPGDTAFTPLSIIDDSFSPGSDGGVPLTTDPASPGMQQPQRPNPTAADKSAPAPARADAADASLPFASFTQSQRQMAPQGGIAENPTSHSAVHDTTGLTATARGRGRREHEHGHRPTETGAQGPVDDHQTTTASPDHDVAKPPSPLPPPLRTGSVQPGTRIAHPKPINLTTSTSSSSTINSPVPDLNGRSGTHVSNVAQLEATAEQLSMTSSIDHAIRDLHGELKRSDSKRSSILAASVRASIDETFPPAPLSAAGLKRHPSNSSSILSNSIAARHGLYNSGSRGISPNNSLTGRLRSGSKNSTGRPDIDFEPPLSRHGPGKASVRSVRSTKLHLTEISESEPVSLDKKAFDEADATSSIDFDPNDDTIRIPEQVDMPNTDAFHKMLGDDPIDHGGPIDLGFGSAEQQYDNEGRDRPSSSRSNNTFQQAQDAFGDFDGVHWEPNEVLDASLRDESDLPTPRQRVFGMGRPQSYIDPKTGQQMLFYPARVPAMLNLPPKLSSRPKAGERNKRRSEVLSAMMGFHKQPGVTEETRHSAIPDLKHRSANRDNTRESWLPDPLAGQRESFIGLSLQDDDPVQQEVDAAEPDPEAGTSAGHLRRPQRLSRMDPENATAQVSRMDELPAQLRASAYFDLPSAAPDVEIKDGSAMATLESILDASAGAPVSAFTDHTFAGKLGAEVYGKTKKRKSQAAAALLQPVPAPQEPKKRSTFMWLGKRGSSSNSDERNKSKKTGSESDVSDADDDVESRPLTSSVDGHSVIRVGIDPPEGEGEDEEEEGEDDDDDAETEDGDEYLGPPTTLLAELQLRKQQQKQRTQPLTRAFPDGMHATLLEMDAVAEAQRKTRQAKRVNLAWEDPDAHIDQNGSEDDEDVPLAIIAAKNQGAKNMADLERPLGLMERRDLEDNEPLSRRRARLQGQEPVSMILPPRRSMINLSAPMTVASRSPSPGQGPSPEPPEEDIEGETLGDRKRRLAAKEEAEVRLPLSRPVSRAFSEELLNQFAGVDEDKENATRGKENTTPGPGGEEETLAQRRARLQAERGAREREMSYGNLVGKLAPNLNRRLSMADVLSAYPKKGVDMQAEEQRRRAAEHTSRASMQLPPTLASQIVNRSGGFQGGAYNDGMGGVIAQNARPSTGGFQAANMGAHAYNNRASAVFGGYGAGIQQPAFGAMPNGGMLNPSMAYNPMNQIPAYGKPVAPMSVYGGNAVQPVMQMQYPATGAVSMHRVERWRQGVSP